MKQIKENTQTRILTFLERAFSVSITPEGGTVITISGVLSGILIYVLRKYFEF